jgi:hypothetical protein
MYCPTFHQLMKSHAVVARGIVGEAPPTGTSWSNGRPNLTRVRLNTRRFEADAGPHHWHGGHTISRSVFTCPRRTAISNGQTAIAHRNKCTASPSKLCNFGDFVDREVGAEPRFLT